MAKKNKQGDRDKKPIKEKVKSGKNKDDQRSKYIFDRDTNQWKMINPAGSTAYNYLTKDEWGWLDME